MLRLKIRRPTMRITVTMVSAKIPTLAIKPKRLPQENVCLPRPMAMASTTSEAMSVRIVLPTLTTTASSRWAP